MSAVDAAQALVFGYGGPRKLHTCVKISAEVYNEHRCVRRSKGAPACSPELLLPCRGGEAGSRVARARAGRARLSASLNKELRDGSLLSAGSRGRLTRLPWLLTPGWVVFLLVFCLFHVYFWLQRV